MDLKVTILKQHGVTGLRKPGTVLLVDAKKARLWKKLGLVSIEKQKRKSKVKIETKELKTEK